MSEMSAVERLKRLLNLLPWLEERGSEGADPQEVADRFDYPVDLLLSDLLETVQFLGDDMEIRYLTAWDLFDLEVSGGRIRLLHNDLVGRPLGVGRARLAEIAASGRSIVAHLDEDGTEREALGPLERAVAKLSASLGPGAESVKVHVLSGVGRSLTMLEEAVRLGRCVEMDYYSYDRDEDTHRIVEPHRCLYDRYWYLTAHCRLAGATRVFRLDRIRSATLLEESFEPPENVATAMDGVPIDGSLPEVTLMLDTSARWVVEQYPNRGWTEVAGGVEVVLPVTATRWMERLLLRLGPAAEVVSAPDGMGEDLLRAAARRILVRYR